jgi:hypothetical protein
MVEQWGDRQSNCNQWGKAEWGWGETMVPPFEATVSQWTQGIGLGVY